MHQCIKFILFLFYFGMALTCFGRSFRPSWGVQDCTYSNGHMSNRYCCLLASIPATPIFVWRMPFAVCTVLNKQTAVSVWHVPVAVCTVLNKQTAVSVWHVPVAVCTVLNKQTAISVWHVPVAVCTVLNKQTALSVWHMPAAVCTVLWTPGDGRKDRPKYVSFQNKIKIK